MNAVTPIEAQAGECLDLVIVGAGISGIGMAVHLTRECKGRSFAILDRRERLGGTWDLFRYPGIRSDSDMHTLGFSFAPWKHERAIADGPAIIDYLEDITQKYGLDPHMRFGHKVLAADWDSKTQRWTLTIEDQDGASRTLQTRFLFLGSGYYDYDDPYDPGFAGRDSFKGDIIHPQFWPENYDYAGKRVVVIGSGATAVTIVPAMAAGGASHVTMLQRTPTWMITRPAKDAIANSLRKVLPEKLAYAITRAKNIVMQDLLFRRARNQPEKVRQYLEGQLRENLGPDYDRTAFTPPYNPWEQRLCLVPDADFFNTINQGKASVATGHIERFDETGILLQSGEHIDADVIVPATGLKLAVAGKIAIRQDGQPVDLAQRFYYRNCMFSNLPNFAVVFGYLNASWTLRVDIVAEFLTRLFNQMDAIGAGVVTPELPDDHGLEEDNIFDFSSGYIQRALSIMPKNAPTLPWRLNQNYRQDRKEMRQAPIDDGILRFERLRAMVEA